MKAFVKKPYFLHIFSFLLQRTFPMTTPTPAASQENPSCAICQEDIVPSTPVSVPYCGHAYHKPCLDKWLEKHVTCPLDQRIIVTTKATGTLFKGCGGTFSSAAASHPHGCGGSSSQSQRPRVQGCGGGNSNFGSGC